jgi:hypothetical protein
MKSFEDEAPTVAALWPGEMYISDHTPLEGICLLVQAAKSFSTIPQLDSILDNARQFWTVYPDDLDRVQGFVFAFWERIKQPGDIGIVPIGTDMLRLMKGFKDEYEAKVKDAKGREL